MASFAIIVHQSKNGRSRDRAILPKHLDPDPCNTKVSDPDLRPFPPMQKLTDSDLDPDPPTKKLTDPTADLRRFT